MDHSEGKRPISHRSLAVVIVLSAFGGWYLTNLHGALYIDEVFYARTGWGLFAGNPYENPTHAVAPTAKYFIGASQHLFGRTSPAVQAPITLLGIGALFLTYRLSELLDDYRTGLLSMLLLGASFPFATQSVRGMLDVPLTFAFIGSLYLVLRWARDE